MKLSHYSIALKDYYSLSGRCREKATLMLYELVPEEVYSVHVSITPLADAPSVQREYPSSRFVSLNGKFPSRETIKKLISKLY